MPKLKTHHWAGVTLSLKNMFGIVPGMIYGGRRTSSTGRASTRSVVDINSSLPAPQFAIVDGIVGMEGNGPIQGDAEGVRSARLRRRSRGRRRDGGALMSIEPRKIKYLEHAAQFLGNVEYEQIAQIGESLESLRKEFRVIQRFESLRVPVARAIAPRAAVLVALLGAGPGDLNDGQGRLSARRLRRGRAALQSGAGSDSQRPAPPLPSRRGPHPARTHP